MFFFYLEIRIFRGLVGKIIARFEERGYKLVALKQLTASKGHLEVHYQDLKEKPFFPGLIDYMASGPIVAMVWQGLDVVKQVSNMKWRNDYSECIAKKNLHRKLEK